LNGLCVNVLDFGKINLFSDFMPLLFHFWKNKRCLSLGQALRLISIGLFGVSGRQSCLGSY
jgi:hypothetical protein